MDDISIERLENAIFRNMSSSKGGYNVNDLISICEEVYGVKCKGMGRSDVIKALLKVYHHDEAVSWMQNYDFEYPSARRIIAIGDIHGDFDVLLCILIHSKVISISKTDVSDTDSNIMPIKPTDIRWVGEDTHVVQLGDIHDFKRCKDIPHSDGLVSNSYIINFLIYLNDIAKEHGGKVLYVIGNHEIMNAISNFDYVSDYEFFDPELSKSTDKTIKDATKSRRKLFAPGSEYCKKLVSGDNGNIYVQIGGWLFTHAGINNKMLTKEEMFGLNKGSKMLFRGMLEHKYVREIANTVYKRNMIEGLKANNTKSCKDLEIILDRLGIYKGVIIGHTVHSTITTYCENKVYAIDVGLSKGFDCHKKDDMLHYLEIIDDECVIRDFNRCQTFHETIRMQSNN